MMNKYTQEVTLDTKKIIVVTRGSGTKTPFLLKGMRRGWIKSSGLLQSCFIRGNKEGRGCPGSYVTSLPEGAHCLPLAENVCWPRQVQR